jgi:drug/metabolite transporter (DMT)-like permease
VLSPELRALLWVFAALALAAGVLLFVFSGNTNDTFSWSIKPSLTAAFLGASYWAACALFVWSARSGTWQRARAALLPAFVIAVLLLVATIVHFDRFHKDLFGYFWLSAYVLVPVLMLLALWRQLRVRSADARDAQPLPGWLRLALGAQAIVMAGVGVALFVSPGSADSLWPWTLTPLTARAIGAFLIGFAAAASWAVFDNDLRHLGGSAWAYALLGMLELIAFLRYPDELDGSGARGVIYVAFVATVLAAGLVGLYLAGVRRVERL